MNYKVGDIVTICVEVQENGRARIFRGRQKKSSTLEKRKFQIISKNINAQTYMIKIDEDINGWFINDFHIAHVGIAKAFKDCKFYEITEDLIE